MDYYNKLTEKQKKKIEAIIQGKFKGEESTIEILKILEDIFNPSGIYKDVYIPLSFLTSDIGIQLLGLLYNKDIDEELTVSQVREELKVSNQYINRLINENKINAKLKGGVYFIRRSELERYKQTRKNIIST